MIMKTFWKASFVLGIAVSAVGGVSAQPECEGQGGARLEVVPQEGPVAVGYSVAFRILGMPLAPVTLAADTGGGPTQVPGVGTFCLDGGPNLRVVFDGIRRGFPVVPPSGAFEFALEIPPRPGLGRQRFFVQGALQDADAPNGFAITNKLDVGVLPSVVETFRNTAMRDAAETTARWEGNGRLIGSVSGARTFELAPPQSPFLLPDPWRTEGSEFQMLFPTSRLQLGPGESIVGMSWGPKSNFVFASRYSGVEMRLGAAAAPTLSPVFDENYADVPGSPTTVFRGEYTVPNGVEETWHPWPEFETDFELGDLGPGLVFQVSVPPGGDTFQLFRNRFTVANVNRRNIAPFGADRSPNPPEDTLYHTRFSVALVTTRAQSLFHDTGQTDPIYFPPRIRLRELPPRTSVSIEVEGADDDDGDGLPDPGSLTGFVDDVEAVNGSDLIRFRLSLRGDFRSGAVPVVDSVAIAFRPSSSP